MANIAVFPSALAPTTISVNGRSYTLAIGSAPILVPDFDAFPLLANGWLAAARDGAGTTAQRPTVGFGVQINPKLGFEYYDSTLGITVIWNGKNWIRVDTGASV